jgi:hypothetical protein
MTMRAVIEFYQPYVSLQTSPSMKRRQAISQIVSPLVLALLASTPMFMAHYWGYALLSTAICFVMLHTIRAFRNWLIAYPDSDGMPYISPSNSPSLLYLFMVTIVLTCLVFMASPYANQ